MVPRRPPGTQGGVPGGDPGWDPGRAGPGPPGIFLPPGIFPPRVSGGLSGTVSGRVPLGTRQRTLGQICRHRVAAQQYG